MNNNVLYFYWGFLGDVKYKPNGEVGSFPDGNAFYSWSIISELQNKGKNVYDTLQDVYNALEEKSYNPINQIVGYLLSGDPAYIPRHNDARNLILKHERDEIIEELVKSYLGKNK